MKKILFTSLVMLMVFIVMACGGGKEVTVDQPQATIDKIKQRGKLIAGVKFDTDLFGYKTVNGEIEGFDADLMRELSKEIFGEESVEFIQVTSKTRIPLLQNGEIDIIAATLSITEERKQQINFSDEYFKAGQTLLVPENSNIKGVEDLVKGTKVIAVKGAITEQNIRIAAPESEVLLFDDHAQSFAALQANKGDALTSDNVILIGLAKEQPGYKLVGDLFTTENYGLGLNKDDEGMTKFVNDWLSKIKENGTYDRLHDKWFSDMD